MSQDTIYRKGVYMDGKAVGQKLIDLRGNKPREQVASDLGISLSALAMYERGERIPRDEIKIKIADYFNKSVQEIFFTQ